MQKFEWRPFSAVDVEKLKETRIQYHRAVQTIAEVGRHFLPKSEMDENAALIWVPGLSRLAGKWVKGRKSFRSSVSLETFSIFLVDQKVSTIVEYPLEGRNPLQVMVWLEEQLVRLGLTTSHLEMNPPYDLADYLTETGESFHLSDPQYGTELGKYFHNSYVAIREIKYSRKNQNPIHVWPHHFDQALDLTIKESGDPATDTRIALGMSPGDDQIEYPYFYVSCWPYANVNECASLSNGAYWLAKDWTGAVLESQHLQAEHQKQILDTFYREASEQLIQNLTK